MSNPRACMQNWPTGSGIDTDFREQMKQDPKARRSVPTASGRRGQAGPKKRDLERLRRSAYRNG
jgi:hypothetical protein